MIWVPLLALLASAETPQSFTAMISGPERSLSMLAAAARECGYHEAAITTGAGGSRIVALEASFGDQDDPWSCTVSWMLRHPNLELGFLGNEVG